MRIEKISPRWKTAPIGGEVAYDWGNFKEKLGAKPDDTLSDPAHRRWLMDSIHRLHANQLGWVANYDSSKPQVRAGAEEVQRAFGYRWVIDEASYPAQIVPQQPFAVSFSVRNLGSAPMYYNWPVEVSLLDANTKAVLWSGIFKDADTRQWLPGEDWNSATGAYTVKPKSVRVEVERFREHDERILLDSFRYQRDEKKLIEIADRSRRELESLFDRDTEERKSA